MVQTTSAEFTERAQSNMRKVSYRVLMSFDKVLDAGIDFFTVGTSTIGSTDIIKGEGDVVQEWDKYAYTDYSDRVISVEWTHQTDNPFSANLAIADITLDNSDDFFSPGGGSPIQNYILPYRPIKIFAGFGDENVPVFIGLTEKMPEIDEKTKQVKFHCIDFLQSIFNRPLDEELLLQDQRVDEILSTLIESAGLTASQYSFDMAFTTVPFAYFPSGMKFGEAAEKLVQADMGYLYLSEDGQVIYRNRQNFSDDSVYSFDTTNILELETPKQDDIINVVEVKSDKREVQSSKQVSESTEAVAIPAGEEVEIWANFSDPVTSVTTPTYTAAPTGLTSEFTANILADGSGPAYSSITLSATLFSTAYKMTFENTAGSDAYITLVRVFGTPAEVVSPVYVRQTDDASIAKYDERPLTVENEYLQDQSTATSLAISLLGIYGELGGIREMEVKSNPALQVHDPITVNNDPYYIMKQEGSIIGGKLTHKMRVAGRTILDLFTIGESSIGGEDVIAA